MKVSEIMQKQVDFVTPDTLLLDVARHIFGRGINGLPVCKDRKVIGFITERDILAKFYPSLDEYIEDPVHTSDFEQMESKVDDLLNIPANKIMSRNVKTVTANTPVLRAQSIMAISKVGRLPVIDRKGNLIGILSKGDIFRAVVGNRLPFEENEQFHDWLARRYDRIIDWKERLGKEIPDLKRLFIHEKVKTILDVGCGTGMHAIALAKEGFVVVGIDKSARMIYEAKQKVRNLSPRFKKNLSFIQGEYKDLQKGFSEKFDAAIIMGTGLAHQSDPEMVLKETEKVLAERAIIVIQIANYKKILTSNKRLFDFNVRGLPFTNEKEYAFLRFYDPKKDGKISYNVAVFERGRKWMFRGMHTISIVPLDTKKMEQALKTIGFSSITFYGGEKGYYYDQLFRSAFKEEQSDVLVVVAKR